jgi:hypothetical protein
MNSKGGGWLHGFHHHASQKKKIQDLGTLAALSFSAINLININQARRKKIFNAKFSSPSCI